jgi:hypothetical protein
VILLGGFKMRYTLTKAIFKRVYAKNGKEGTPIVGYALYDKLLGKNVLFNRFEAYVAVSTYGATNADAYIREVSCKEDMPDKNGRIYYLKPNDGKKINEYF